MPVPVAADSRGALAGIHPTVSPSPGAALTLSPSVSITHSSTRGYGKAPPRLKSHCSFFCLIFLCQSVKKWCWTSRLSRWPPAPGAVPCHHCLSAGHLCFDKDFMAQDCLTCVYLWLYFSQPADTDSVGWRDHRSHLPWTARSSLTERRAWAHPCWDPTVPCLSPGSEELQKGRGCTAQEGAGMWQWKGNWEGRKE